MKAALALVAVLLAGCGPYNDVAHYDAHPDERAEQIAECDNHPALSVSPNCLSARKSLDRASFSGSDMPSIR